MILFLCFLWKKVGGNDLENLNQIENLYNEMIFEWKNITKNTTKKLVIALAR